MRSRQDIATPRQMAPIIIRRFLGCQFHSSSYDATLFPRTGRFLGSRSQAVSALRRLADQILAAHGLEAVERLLTGALPAALGVASATLLVWNRKLDAFEALAPGDARSHPVRPDEPGVSAPEARYLISDGQLLETAGGSGSGVLLPLMARAGLTGMLVLGPRRGRRLRPYRPAEVRGLSLVAARAAGPARACR